MHNRASVENAGPCYAAAAKGLFRGLENSSEEPLTMNPMGWNSGEKVRFPKLYPILDADLVFRELAPRGAGTKPGTESNDRAKLLRHLVRELAHAGVEILQYRNKRDDDDGVLVDALAIREAAESAVQPAPKASAAHPQRPRRACSGRRMGWCPRWPGGFVTATGTFAGGAGGHRRTFDSHCGAGCHCGRRTGGLCRHRAGICDSHQARHFAGDWP